jgi:hypothetical protein
MDLQLDLGLFAANLDDPGFARLVALVAFGTCLTLAAAMLLQSREHRRVKRELATLAGGGPAVSRGDPSTGLSLDGISLSPIDRVFPRQPMQFLMLVATISIGVWIAGYALAPNKRHFLSSPEWLFQPFYLASHLVALRLFINVFTRNYAAGIAQLDVSRLHALRGIRPILGARGALMAAIVAAPFCYFDFIYLFSDRYQRMGRDEVVRAADYLMWTVWSVEWFINAFIWVLLIGFMLKNCATIARFPFRCPIDTVLNAKLYRPFLQMSAQGATVVLAFSLVTVAYLYYTGGEATDYTGLGITVALLVVCFVPPWLVLRSKVDRAVHERMEALRLGAGLIAGASAAQVAFDMPAIGEGARTVEERLDEVLALLRIEHLSNLYGNLGQTEAKAIVVRLLAPALTIGWQLANNHGELGKRLSAMLKGASGL